VIVSHDRHMLELTADRLILIDDGTAKEFNGSIDDYTDFILGRNTNETDTKANGGKRGKQARKAAADARKQNTALRSTVLRAEARIAALEVERTAVDRAMFSPKDAEGALAAMTMTELMKRRAQLEARIETEEARWTEASEKLEAVVG